MSKPHYTADHPFRIGTRGSPLALAQAHETQRRLMLATGLPQEAFEICVIKVTGDAIQDRPLNQIGGKGLFTREIEEALLAGDIDIAVHSSKDMPVDQPPGLILSTFLPREDVRDAFVSYQATSIHDLPQGAVVGTSSLRRRAQLLAKRPDLEIVEFRGNVQTRLRKLSDGVAVATFLAQAGLNRLDMDDVPATPVSTDDMLPAIAQGAIGIEARIGDEIVGPMLDLIHHAETGLRLAAERSLLATLDGSCQTPIGGLAEISGDMLTLRGEILRPDGTTVLTDQVTGPVATGADMGRAMGERLLSQAGPGFFD